MGNEGLLPWVPLGGSTGLSSTSYPHPVMRLKQTTYVLSPPPTSPFPTSSAVEQLRRRRPTEPARGRTRERGALSPYR